MAAQRRQRSRPGSTIGGRDADPSYHGRSQSAMTGHGSIGKHVGRDGTVTWQVRVDQRNPQTRRHYAPRTFGTLREAQAGLKRWLVELACEADAQRIRSYPVYLYWGQPRIFVPTIYFVAAAATSAIKIGQSNHVPGRVRALQTATADTLRLLGMQPGGKDEERRLHKRFAKLHIRGEWYAARKPLVSYIIQQASSPYCYYASINPDLARDVLRAYPDVFGTDEERWTMVGPQP